MTTLIIAEKPSLGRAIAQALHSQNIIVKPAQGHLLEFVFPKTEKWSMDLLPLKGLKSTELKLIQDRDGFKKKLLNEIGQSLKGATEIVSAGDPDAEGSLLTYNIIVHFGLMDFSFNSLTKVKITRMHPLAMDKKSLQAAFRDREPIESDIPLVSQGLGRTYSDAIVGFNLTQSASIVQGNFNSVGRVQTPTLQLIYEREKQIENFVPEHFLNVIGEFSSFNGESFNALMFKILSDGTETTRLKVDFDTEKYLRPLIGQPFKVLKCNGIEKSQNPPLLPNMNDILKKVGVLFKMKTKTGTKILQELYEAKAISYPRTELRYLPTSMKSDIKTILDELSEQLNITGFILDNKRIYNDKALEGASHYAIIPMDVKPQLKSEEQRQVFNLIRDWFIVAFLPPYQYLSTTVILNQSQIHFKAIGNSTLSKGFTAYPTNLFTDKKDVILPKMAVGDSVVLDSFEANKDQTKPPPKITEPSLLDLMENIHKLYNKNNENAVEGLSLGTPATRSSIIETLKKREYISTQGKFLVTSEKGRNLLAFIGNDISIDLTAQFERKLSEIGKGRGDYQEFIEEIQALTIRILDKHKKMPVKARDYLTLKHPPTQGEVVAFPNEKSIKGFKTIIKGEEHLVWAKSFGRKFSLKEAIQLLIQGNSISADNFVSKAGKKYRATVRYSLLDKKLILSFD